MNTKWWSHEKFGQGHTKILTSFSYICISTHSPTHSNTQKPQWYPAAVCENNDGDCTHKMLTKRETSLREAFFAHPLTCLSTHSSHARSDVKLHNSTHTDVPYASAVVEEWVSLSNLLDVLHVPHVEAVVIVHHCELIEREGKIKWKWNENKSRKESYFNHSLLPLHLQTVHRHIS